MLVPKTVSVLSNGGAADGCVSSAPTLPLNDANNTAVVSADSHTVRRLPDRCIVALCRACGAQVVMRARTSCDCRRRPSGGDATEALDPFLMGGVQRAA